MSDPRLGFDSYTSEGDFYRDDSPEQQRIDEQRDFAFGGGLLKGITELPLDIMEFLSPEDEYNPGALAPDQSSPRQRIRTERLHGEQFYDELKSDPITKQAAEVGYGASMVVDPVLDTGILMAPHLLKGLNAIRKGEKPAIKLADLMTDEVGSVGDLSDNLPTSVEQRMERATEQGFTTEAYTGSTHDIKEFEGSLSNPENDWGRGTYASTSVDDVNANYAGEGPDLTSRIDIRTERIESDVSDMTVDEIEEAFGVDTDKAESLYSEYEAGESTLARSMAKKELIGPAEGGVVYPLKINTKNYAVIGGHNPTRITVPDFDELAKKEIDRADYDDLDDYEMAVEDRRFELMDESEESLHAQVNDAMRDTDLWEEEGVMQEIMGELDEEIMDGDLRVDSIDDAVRRHVVDAYDDNGEMLSSGDISSQIIKNLGFDGVVDMKVNQKFGTGREFGTKMEGVNPDTAHVVTFPGKEETIRSRHAMFDPKKIKSKDILASAIGVGAVAGAGN